MMHRGSSGQPDTDSAVLHKYYTEHDYLTSPEAIMKVISVIMCIALSAVLFSGSCRSAPLLVAGASLELVSAAALVCLYAARALQLAVYAPMGYLMADLVISTAIGILLLVTAILSVTLCEMARVTDYIHGPLGMVNACVVTGSAIVTYASVTRRWDAARRASAAAGADSAARRPPGEQDA